MVPGTPVFGLRILNGQRTMQRPKNGMYTKLGLGTSLINFNTSVLTSSSRFRDVNILSTFVSIRYSIRRFGSFQIDRTHGGWQTDAEVNRTHMAIDIELEGYKYGWIDRHVPHPQTLHPT